MPGGDIFGFTSGTVVGNPGDCGVAFEFSGRAVRPMVACTGTPKTQFAQPSSTTFSVALSPFITYHHIRNVTDLEDQPHPVRRSLRRVELSSSREARRCRRATFSIEPRWARVDGTRVSADGIFRRIQTVRMWCSSPIGSLRCREPQLRRPFRKTDGDPLGE